MKFFLGTLILLLIIQTNFSFAQSYQTTRLSDITATTINVSDIKEDWRSKVQNLEAPNPSGKRGELAKLKQQFLETYPKKIKDQKSLAKTQADFDSPSVTKEFQGNAFSGGSPSDNDIAISNDQLLVSVSNTVIYIYDMKEDSLLKEISLGAFVEGLDLTAQKFDPRVIYDPLADRFILAFINGNLNENSRTVLAFSASNDPTGDWHIYPLPGNLLDNDTWADYPTMAISEEEVFISINTFTNGSVNNSGYVESTFWQIGKAEAYAGEELETEYYYDIQQADGQSIFNLTPVQGGSMPYGPNMYLLSNRNLALESDTLFLLEVTSTLDDPNTKLETEVLILPESYLLPVVARQFGSKQLDTNDSRVLDAFYENGYIEFVQNTTHFWNDSTAFTAILHGVIEDVANTKEVSTKVIANDIWNLAYPSITYTGIDFSERQSMISLVYSSAYPGFAALYHNAGEYSDLEIIQTGKTTIDLSPVTNLERWGDYTGAQRDYANPAHVWASGSFGEKNTNDPDFPDLSKRAGTWIAQLEKPYIESEAPTTTQNVLAETPKLLAFPNPTTDHISFEFELVEGHYLDISVYNLEGRLIKTLLQDKFKKGKNRLSFATTHLPKGVYLLVIKEDNKVCFKEKFIRS